MASGADPMHLLPMFNTAMVEFDMSEKQNAMVELTDAEDSKTTGGSTAWRQIVS